MFNKNNNGQSKVWLLVLGLLGLVVLGFVFFNEATPEIIPPTPADTQEGMEEVGEEIENLDMESGVATEANGLVVSNQSVEDSIFVETAILEVPGYVVIHKTEADGSAGEVIGFSNLLPAGETEDFVILMDEEIFIGEELIAMLHADDGDAFFEYPGADQPILDQFGNPVQVIFEINAELE